MTAIKDNKPKFTPGPWKFATEGNAKGLPIDLIRSESGLELAFTTHPDFEGIEDAQEREANAELIASAPTLYEENIKLKRVNEELLETLKVAGSAIRNGFYNLAEETIEAAIIKAAEHK